MPYKLMEDGGYHLGVMRDPPVWRLPPGAVADASNMLFDTPAIARQRGPSTALSGPTTTAFSTSIGFAYSQDATPIEELYGLNGKDRSLYSVNQSTGVATLVATVTAGSGVNTVGRAITHAGFVIFPILGSNGARYIAAAGGQTSSTTFTNAVNATVTAGNQQITLTGADVTTNVKVGGMVYATDLGTNLLGYIGRVVSIDTTKLFTVFPTPSASFTATPGGLQVTPSIGGIGGTCGASFQNRLLLGNGQDHSSINQSLVTERRVYYSPLPTETSAQPYAGVPAVTNGAHYINPAIWPVLNYFDVPGADPIVALEPVNDGELLILTTTSAHVLAGQLATQTATSAPGITFDLFPLIGLNGCARETSVVKTPIGVCWAGPNGIFAYWPPLRRSVAHTGLRNLLDGKLLRDYLTLVNGSNFAVHGAFFSRNHYVVSLSSGGTTYSLAYNLANESWTFLTGPGTDIFMGVPKPSNAARVFVSRWWDATGAAPTHTGGHIVRVETMFQPDTAGQTKLDSDGAVVACSLTSRTLTDDTYAERIVKRVGVRYQAQMAGANVAVTAGTRLDSQETGGTPTQALGSLSNTAVLTCTAATNATPIVVTSTAHGLQTGDQVDTHAFATNTNANGRFQITVLTANTFSLNGSVGNGATGTGTARKISDQEFDATSLDIGQGLYIKLASAGTVNAFAVHEVRAGVMEITRGIA